jgi:hypothetical protein
MGLQYDPLPNLHNPNPPGHCRLRLRWKVFCPYVHNPAALTGVTREAGSLTITADPLLDRHSCQTNFGMDCLQKGILPVYLITSNGSTNMSYKIVSSNIWFSTGLRDARQVKSGLQQTNTSAAGSGVAVAGSIMGGLGGVLVAGFGMKLTDDEESIRENFVIKQFQNVDLGPGKSAEGFVYFTQPYPIPLESLPSVNIPVVDLKSQATNTISLPLNQLPREYTPGAALDNSFRKDKLQTTAP